MIASPANEKVDDLLKTIKFLRKEMIHLGIQEGLTSEKTIKISRKLDIFITKYQRMNNRNNQF